MTASILVLDDAVASQIAAGEVVERPASIVKELIENSKDAEATHIRIFFDAGGTTLIRVVDDGVGMVPEDATLCFARHATSKLTSIEQLNSLSTFGFRGEALAAISSVSRVTLLTKPETSASAFKVVVDAGTFETMEESNGHDGTSVTVERLFDAVPARRAFLKTARTEKARILQHIKSQAIFSPEIGFSVIADGKSVLELPAAEDLESRCLRVSACLGGDLSDLLTPFTCETELLQVEGFITPPHVAARTSGDLFVAINDRPVSDRALHATIRMAFRSAIGPRRFPRGAFHIRTNPTSVDVNVHPRKEEVRFTDHRRTHAHLLGALSDVAARAPWSKSSKEPKRYVLHGGQAETEKSEEADPYANRRDRIRDAMNKAVASRPTTARFSERAESKRTSTHNGTHVATIRGRFLLVEQPSGIVWIDAKRSLGTLLQSELEGTLSNIPSRRLLFPLRVSVSPPWPERYEQDKAACRARGFDIDSFSESGVVVRAVPAAVCGQNPEAVFDAYHAWHSSGDSLSVLPSLLVAAFLKDRPLTKDELNRGLVSGLQRGAGLSISFEELTKRLNKESPRPLHQSTSLAFDRGRP